MKDETKSKKKKDQLQFPASILKPVNDFLSANLHKLKERKKEVEKGDPFKNTARIADNAAPDTEAEEQFDHVKTSAIKQEIERKIIQTRKALSKVKVGKYGICDDCGNMIDTERLMAYPEAIYCTACQKKREK